MKLENIVSKIQISNLHVGDIRDFNGRKYEIIDFIKNEMKFICHFPNLGDGDVKMSWAAHLIQKDRLINRT